MSEVLILAFSVLLAVTFHEAAHAYVAFLCGDLTAKNLGRLSLNPLRHVDPVGTIALPAALILTGAPILFGWAKPVPVAFFRLRNPRRDTVFVSLAGPGANLFLAVAAVFLKALALYVLDVFDTFDLQQVFEWLMTCLYHFVWINVMLAVFNMIPLPPLDGGRVLRECLPQEAASVLDRFENVGGIFVVIFVIAVLPLIGDHLGIGGLDFAPKGINAVVETIGDRLWSATFIQNL